MSYKVLALKYRPQNFQDVVGQEHVTTTFSNAIISNRVAHAILLTGPRGTGKTTIARILAKAMNCEQGPTPTPCNLCKSCKSITSGNASDVFEIDGASNNSVDQIRELRANVTYMPTSSKFKIYIIDEVHMLSTAAFNALLKTLEEPPDHVIFIFATTESHKIPITILSRCQRHDLGRLKLTQISDHLQKLCGQENFIIPKESLDLIASEADGSMRDSLSLLDRILSSSPTNEISHNVILNNLGIIDKKVVFDICESVFKHDVNSILGTIDKIHDLGMDLKKFYSAIIKHFRNFMIIKACGKNSTATDITDSDRETIHSMISDFSLVYLTRILHTLLKDELLIKSASNTRIALEMVMLKLVQARPGLEIDQLIRKINLLAEQFKARMPSQPHQNNPGSLNHTYNQAPPAITDNPQPELSPDNAAPHRQAASLPYTKEISESEQYIHEEHFTRENIAPFNTSSHAAQTVKENGSSVNLPVTPSPRTLATSGISAQAPGKNWDGFLKTVSLTMPVLSTILDKSHVRKMTDAEISLEITGSPFNLSRINTQKNELQALCNNYFEKNFAINIIDSTETTQLDNDSASSPSRLKQEAMSHPLVAHAVKIFSGNVVDVKIKEVK